MEIWHFADLLSPPPTFVNVFPISLGKCPVSLFQSMVSYLPGAGKEAFRRAGKPVSQGKEIRAGEYNGRTVSFRLPDKRRGTLSGGTDGRVPFVLPPRCPASAMQLPEWSETDAGTGQPVRKVQAQESENPFTHVRDCRGKPTA